MAAAIILAFGLGPASAAVEPGLARCAAVEQAEARLACFDALAAEASGPTKRANEALESPDAAPTTSTAPESEPMQATEAPGPVGKQKDSGERRTLAVRLYRRNYLLPFTYNENLDSEALRRAGIDDPSSPEDPLDKAEMKFQISFEVPLWTKILNQDLDLYFGYTQLAFFQAYNHRYSSPFRDTNYEPELGLNWDPGVAPLGWRIHSMRLAADHQSNGRSEPLSRSWNRLIGQIEAEHEDVNVGLRLWTLLGANPSDNPDITDYLGYGELRADWNPGEHRLGAMFRSFRHPTVQLDWSYPIGPRLRLYAQYFNGYGESLIDYNHSVNRIGVGFLLNDWP